MNKLKYFLVIIFSIVLLNPLISSAQVPVSKIKSFSSSSKSIIEGSNVSVPSNVDRTNSYKVHVLGEVNIPGIYHIYPANRVLDAVKLAGGLTNHGSSRAIELRRKNKKQKLDLFSYQTLGELSQNPYVSDDDVIFVPLKKGEIQIEGPIKRPGFYEILGKTNLSQVIKLAGGFAQGLNSKDSIRVIRYTEDGKKVIELDYNHSQDKKFKIIKGDIIIVPHILIADKKFDYNVERIPGDNIFYPTINDSIYVIGAVTKPGPYPFQPQFGYLNYINQAGPDALASIRRSKVIGSDGMKRLARKLEDINPGDTIIVPAKSVTFTKVLELVGDLTSTTLSSILIYDRIKDN